jgi:hypothetical protein
MVYFVFLLCFYYFSVKNTKEKMAKEMCHFKKK